MYVDVEKSKSAAGLISVFFSVTQASRSSTSMVVKKQSSDWSSGWDADDSWSNEKEGQGQSSAGEEGWGNDWGEEETDTSSANKTLPLPEGVRLASEYNWDSTTKGASQNDLFASVSQRNTASMSAATVRAQWAKNTKVGFQIWEKNNGVLSALLIMTWKSYMYIRGNTKLYPISLKWHFNRAHHKAAVTWSALSIMVGFFFLFLFYLQNKIAVV